MKTLIRLLAIPLTLALLSCGEAKAPKKEDFQDRIIYSFPYVLKDNDGDGKIDEIYDKDFLSIPLYIADSSSPHKTGRITKEMSSELRSSASDLLKATRNFDFNLERQRYSDFQKRRKKQNTDRKNQILYSPTSSSKD